MLSHKEHTHTHTRFFSLMSRNIEKYAMQKVRVGRCDADEAGCHFRCSAPAAACGLCGRCLYCCVSCAPVPRRARSGSTWKNVKVVQLGVLTMVCVRLTRATIIITVWRPERVHNVVNVRTNVRCILREHVFPVLTSSSRAGAMSSKPVIEP